MSEQARQDFGEMVLRHVCHAVEVRPDEDHKGAVSITHKDATGLKSIGCIEVPLLMMGAIPKELLEGALYLALNGTPRSSPEA